MSKEIITKNLFWWGWEPEKVENWLEKMALEGWQVIKVNSTSTKFTFEKAAPQKIKFCTDFQYKVDENYNRIFKDDGWDLLWNGAVGWYIWKKSYKTNKPYIYTDSTSLVEKNNRLFNIILMFTCLITFYQVSNFLTLLNHFKTLNIVLFSIYIIPFSFLIYCLVKIKLYIKKIKSN